MRVVPRLLLAVLLAGPGCSTYAPTPLSPRDVLTELRAIDVALPEEGISPGGAVAVALVHNPDLHVVRRDHAIAEGLVISQSAWENPELRLSLDNLYSRAHDSFEWAIGLRFFPPRPGEIDVKTARAEARSRRVLALIEEREAAVAADARRAHARLVFLDTEVRSVRAAAALHERIASLTRQAVAAGATTRIDATLVTLRREELADETHALQSDRAIARAELAALMGLSPDAPLTVVRAVPREEVALGSQAELEETALALRADLRALVESYEVREQQLHLSHLARLPWFRHVEPGSAHLPSDGTVDIGVAVELPIFDDGANALSIAEARRDRARDAYRARLHRVRGEIRLARLRFDESRRRHAHLSERLEPILLQAEDLVSAALDRGAVDLLAVVAVEARVLGVRRDSARAAFDLDVARIELAAATGSVHALP